MLYPLSYLRSHISVLRANLRKGVKTTRRPPILRKGCTEGENSGKSRDLTLCI